jgi:hypothetical protein
MNHEVIFGHTRIRGNQPSGGVKRLPVRRQRVSCNSHVTVTSQVVARTASNHPLYRRDCIRDCPPGALLQRSRKCPATVLGRGGGIPAGYSWRVPGTCQAVPRQVPGKCQVHAWQPTGDSVPARIIVNHPCHRAFTYPAKCLLLVREHHAIDRRPVETL